MEKRMNVKREAPSSSEETQRFDDDDDELVMDIKQKMRIRSQQFSALFHENQDDAFELFEIIKKQKIEIAMQQLELTKLRKIIEKKDQEILELTSGHQEVTGSEPGIPPAASDPEVVGEVPEKIVKIESVERKNSQVIEKVAKPVKKESHMVAPITEAEFNTIPKYMIGKFTLEMLNEIIKAFDDFLKKKTMILTKKYNQLTEVEKPLWKEFKKLEEKSNKRMSTTAFCVESDIRCYQRRRNHCSQNQYRV